MNVYPSGWPVRPKTMETLPLDKRGYPVPYFVRWFNNEPNFTAVDQEKMIGCMKHDLCWICGHPLLKKRVMIVGPLSALQGMTSEPPSHIECSEYACLVCPWINRSMIRRNDKAFVKDMYHIPDDKFLARQPSVMLWYEVERSESNKGYVPTVVRSTQGLATVLMLAEYTRLDWIGAKVWLSRENAFAELQKAFDSLVQKRALDEITMLRIWAIRDDLVPRPRDVPIELSYAQPPIREIKP